MARLEEVCEILDSRRVPITAKDRVAGLYPYYGANGVQDYVADYIFDDELVLLAEDGGHFGSTDKPIAYRVSGKCWVNNHAHVLKPKECIDVDYLCYSLMFRDVSDIVNGATRQKLTQADMRKIEIPLLSMTEQKAVVDKLGKVFELIALRKEQLAKLDQLVKSRFIELFGDPETNPKGLKIVALSEIAEYYNGLTYSPDDVSENGTVVLRSSNIQNSRLDFADIVRVACHIKDKFFVKENDILMCSRNGSAKLVGKVALINNLQEPMSFGAFMMIIRSNYYPYLQTYFQMDAFRRQIKTGATTTINQITGNMLGKIMLPLPDDAPVQQFAVFVEHTDKLKLATQQSLDKLETLKKSLMQEYFG